jgi:hypothetical protein
MLLFYFLLLILWSFMIIQQHGVCVESAGLLREKDQIINNNRLSTTCYLFYG